MNKSKRMKSFSLALSAASLLIGLGCSPSWAECVGGVCADVYVEQLYTQQGTSSFYIRTTGTETALNCTPDSGVYLFVPATSKEMFAVLLAAQMTDKMVAVRIIESSNPCTVSWVTMNR